MTNRYHVGDQPHSIIIRMKRLDREYTLEELKNEYEVTDAPVLKLELQGPLGRYVLEREEREGDDGSLLRFRLGQGDDDIFKCRTTWRCGIVLSGDNRRKVVGTCTIGVFPV